MNTRPEPTKPDPPSKDTEIDTDTTDEPVLTDSQGQPIDPKDPKPDTSVDRGG